MPQPAIVSIDVNQAAPALSIQTPAAAAESIVTGTSTQLTVTAADSINGAAITYTWTLVNEPNGVADPTFSDNGTGTANDTTVSFSSAGQYQFELVIADNHGLSVTSSLVDITVESTPTSLLIAPGTIEVAFGQTQQFNAVAIDQFDNYTPAPVGLTWQCTGDGSINASTGVYTSPADGTTATITAQFGAIISNAASVMLVASQPASFSATAPSTAEVDLTWQPSNDPTVTEYFVFRDTTPSFEPSIYNEVGESTVANFNDNTVAANTTYYYKVYGTSDSSVLAAGSATTPATDGSMPGAPTGLTTRGLNDLEIELIWTNSARSAGTDIYVSRNANMSGETELGIVPAGVTTYIARGLDSLIPPSPTDPNWAEHEYDFFQRGVSYYFQVVSQNTSGTAPSNIVPGRTVTPTSDDIVIVIGGFRQNEWELEAGESVGKIWNTLVDDGYNAYLTAEAPQSGFSGIGTGISWLFGNQTDGGVVNWNGSGVIYDELVEETKRGQAEIALIGYSHGGGIVANMSERISEDRSSSSGFGPITENPLTKVVYVATIDAVQRDVGALVWPSPVKISPGAFWPGGAQWHGQAPLDAVIPLCDNVYETNGAPPFWFVITADTHGGPMTGAALQNEVHLTEGPQGAKVSHINIYDVTSIQLGIEIDLEDVIPIGD
jgi:hypothetical protein